MAGTAWIDLLDPDEEELRKHVPDEHSSRRAATAPAAGFFGGGHPSVRQEPRRLHPRPGARGRCLAGRRPRLLPGGRFRPHPRTDRHRAQDAGRRAAVRPQPRPGALRRASSRGATRDDRLLPRRRDRRAVPRPARRHRRGDRRAGGARRRVAAREDPQAHLAVPTRPAPHPKDALRRREMRCARSWTAGSTSRVGCRSRAKCSQTRSSASSQPPTTSCFGPQRRSSTPASCSPPSVITSRHGSRSTRTKR